MSKFFALAVLILSFIAAGETFAQEDRAAILAAELDKTKHKKKEKKGFSFEFYTEVKNTPAVKEATAYSGSYSTDGGHRSLNLTVSADGRATGTGHEMFGFGEEKVSYKLVDARVSGAVLTGTRVYSNGKTEPFEAVFVTRTVSAGKNPNSIETNEAGYGLGYKMAASEWEQRVFLPAVR